MKTKNIFLIAALVAASFTTYAQVGVGTTNPKGALDVVSTNSGLIVPRVANTAAITTPINGMIIYDISSNCYKGYQNGAWTDCGFVSVAPNAVLAQVGNEGDSPNTVPSVVTATQLVSVPGVTGVVPANEAAYQAYIDANPALFSVPATVAEVNAMITAVNAAAPTTITSSTTGKIWMDRNLGATQVATSSTDVASYGDLYQWGRKKDGHQIRTSSQTAGPVAAGNEGVNFITSSSDWLTAQDNTRWQTVGEANNPCPSGYRLPTEPELNNERAAFSTNNAAGAYASALKLPVAGDRSRSNGTLGNVGSSGFYWSSTVSGTSARALTFNSSTALMTSFNRANGFSVRCIKD